MSIDTVPDITPGVILFDDPIARTNGWSCYQNQTANTVRSAQELTSAGVWLTNMDDSSFRSSGLAASNRFRMEDYLRTSLTSIAIEQGVAVEKDNWIRPIGRACAEHLANCFGSVMDVAWRLGVERFPPKQLRIGFRALNLPLDYTPDHGPEMSAILKDACQRYTISERRLHSRSIRYEERPISFVRHRYTHAQEMLSKPIPSGRWRIAPRMSAEEICSHHRPLLIEVQVHEIEPPLGSIINFGGTMQNATANARGHRGVDAPPRRWMTQPEFAYISPRAKISVMQILEAETYIPNPLAENLPPLGDLQQMSHCFNLAIESYWTAGYRDERGRSDHSPLAAWMSAYDRIACINEAIALIERDPEIDITGLGFGRITFRIVNPGKQAAEWCASMIKGTCLIPPLIPGLNGVSGSEPTSAVEAMQMMQLYGEPALIPEQDLAAIQDFDHQLIPADLAE